MNPANRILVVGIGSGHGDDQAGWQAIESLSGRIPARIKLRRASVPHDLIDWLDDCDVLHVVDACKADEDASRAYRFDVVASSGDVTLQQSSSRTISDGVECLVQPPRLRSGSSHQIDLMSVLELARRLNTLPRKVVLWTVPGARFNPGTALSPVCEAGLATCVDRISAELGDA